jgi:hypothetical protein
MVAEPTGVVSDDSRRPQVRTTVMIDDVLRKVTAADCNI